MKDLKDEIALQKASVAWYKQETFKIMNLIELLESGLLKMSDEEIADLRNKSNYLICKGEFEKRLLESFYKRLE